MTKDILHRTRYLSKQQTKQVLYINFYIGNILIIVHRETKNIDYQRREKQTIFQGRDFYDT